MLAIAAPLLLGNRDLLQEAASGMLEIPGAVFTLAAASAWMASRDWVDVAAWGTALLGNLLFHTKFQYGLMFAAAVLGLEAVEGGRWRRLPAVGRALLGEVRQPLFLVVLGVLASCTLLAFRAVAGGGVAADSILGLPDGLRTPGCRSGSAPSLSSPWCSWRCGEAGRCCRRSLTPRVRFFWVWLLTPMLAWLLVPFTWRLEVLLDSVRFDSHQLASGGLQERSDLLPPRGMGGLVRSRHQDGSPAPSRGDPPRRVALAVSAKAGAALRGGGPGGAGRADPAPTGATTSRGSS